MRVTRSSRVPGRLAGPGPALLVASEGAGRAGGSEFVPWEGMSEDMPDGVDAAPDMGAGVGN